MKDIELITQIKNNSPSSSSALNELVLRHSGICHEMIKRYQNAILSSGNSIDDIQKDKMYIIYKSALNFNENKNVKFSTWLGNQMRYHCLNTINSRSRTINIEEESMKKIIEKNQLFIKKSHIKDQSDYCLSMLDQFQDERIKKIFKLRYFDAKKIMSWHKIGKKLKISTQTAINLHNKGKKILKNKLTSANINDII
jgi:RNA polymerase sigma factor (sigma-70 family)